KAEFEKELEISPNHPQSLAYLGNIELKKNNLENAASFLEKSIKERSDLRIALMDLGEVRTQLKQYPAAISAYQRAIALAPDQPDAHYRLGRVYQSAGEPEKSKKEFATARELHQKEDAAAVLRLNTPRPSPQ